jgi:hypothetical protein
MPQVTAAAAMQQGRVGAVLLLLLLKLEAVHVAQTAAAAAAVLVAAAAAPARLHAGRLLQVMWQAMCQAVALQQHPAAAAAAAAGLAAAHAAGAAPVQSSIPHPAHQTQSHLHLGHSTRLPCGALLLLPLLLLTPLLLHCCYCLNPSQGIRSVQVQQVGSGEGLAKLAAAAAAAAAVGC